MKTLSQPRNILLKKYEEYVIKKMGTGDKWEIEHRLAHIHGHKAGLKIWVEGRQRDSEIREYFENKERDNRDGYFFYNSIMKPSYVEFEKIESYKSGNRMNLILTYKRK